MEINKNPIVKIKENSINILSVARINSFGAFLDAGTGNSSDDILLHKDQQTSPVKEGDSVRVFIYHDPHHRLTASMNLPKIEIGEIGYVEVLLTTRFGAFVDIGTERGIFLPFSEMIEPVTAGQHIWIKLYKDKTGRLAVTTKVNEEMNTIALPINNKKIGDYITGTVYNKTSTGVFIITRNRELGFIYKDELVGNIKLGSEVCGRITYIRSDGHVNISLRELKQNAILTDMDILINCMKTHDGILPYTDKSDPSDIRCHLNLSKSAFKRAVGHLLKLGKITNQDGKFKLTK